jgi:hypothetical protein
MNRREGHNLSSERNVVAGVPKMSSTLTFEFIGFTYRQNPKAPELFAFVASADKLAKICGVARKSQDLLQNYQRALDEPRLDREVAPFFRIPENCSPTAIVLSLHETPLAKISFEKAKGLEGEFLHPKILKIEMRDPASLSVDEVVQLSKEFLDNRIATGAAGNAVGVTTQANSSTANITDAGMQGGASVKSSEETTEEGVESEEEDEELVEDGDGVEEEGTEDEEEDDGATLAAGPTEEPVEIGKSMLKNMRALLDKPELLKPDVIESLRETLLPALVIDGQHRLFGAAKVEEDIPFLVCSLVKPEWKEQVFQFTVINDKALGIPKPFITSLAGMSLTGQELKELTSRLSQAGVQLWEVSVMQKMGYDPESPFHNLIEFKVDGSPTVGLGYQTMKRVGKAWFDPQHQGLISLIRILYSKPGERKKSTKTLKSTWSKSDEWFKYFVRFWSEAKKRLGTPALWKLHSPLLTAVVLEQFQEAFLTYMDSVVGLTLDKITEDDDEKRRQLVEDEFFNILTNFLVKFDPKHFSKPWAIKSLNHKSGKDQLADYFDKILKGAQVHKHPLVTPVKS